MKKHNDVLELSERDALEKVAILILFVVQLPTQSKSRQMDIVKDLFLIGSYLVKEWELSEEVSGGNKPRKTSLFSNQRVMSLLGDALVWITKLILHKMDVTNFYLSDLSLDDE